MFAKENGKRLANGSFDGAIGLVVNKKADGLVRSIDYQSLDANLVDYSLTVKSELYVTSEYLDVQSSDFEQSFHSLYEMFSPLLFFFIECLILFVLSFIFFTLILFLSYRDRKKPNLISKSIETFFKFKKTLFKKPNAIGIFLVSFLLLEAFIQNIIQNNINVSMVVVDQSALTTSTVKLLNSKKKGIF